MVFLTRRIAAVRKGLSRATPLPFAVRCAIAVCFLAALLVAWPTALLTGRYFPLFLVFAVLPAAAPRGRGATLTALVVVAGWVIDTVGEDAQVPLWRVLTIATTLYLGHTLTALAAGLPYDAVVNLDVIGTWLARAAAVLLISAVLTVVALGLATELAGGAFLLATIVGLVGATAATLLLARLIRRS